MECLVEFDYKAEEEDELNLTKGDRITGVETKHDGWWEGTLNGRRGLFPDNFVRVITPNASGSSTTAADTNAAKIGEVGDTPKMRQKAGPGPHPRRLKAIFSYAPVQDDELQLDVGDVIHFMDEIEEGWWKGELKGRVGIFPSNFVSEVDREVNGNVVPPEGKGEKETVRNRDTFIAKNKVIPDIIPAYQSQSKDEESEIAPKLPPKPGTTGGVRETAKCFYPYFASNDDELTIMEGDLVTIISKECEDEGWWRGELRGKIGVFPDNFVEIVTANSPTTSLPAANQPKVTAQERTDDSKKEVRHPATLPIASTVVDGVGGSKGGIKTETKVASQIKAFAKKESPTTKGPAPLSPISPVTNVFGGFSIKRESPQPHASSPLTDEVNLNSIERSSETLSHLTASRAKAPKRRPPSAIITREDEHEYGQMNGSGTTSLPMQAVKEGDHAPPPFVRTNSHTIHVPDGTTVTAKETSPSPAPQQPTPVAVNKPKTAIPWMAELKLKQDKKTTGLGSPTAPTTPPTTTSNNNNNISTVIVSPPAAASITTSSTPPAAPHAQAKAPPLPVKPNIPTPSPPTVQHQQQAPTTEKPVAPTSTNKFGGAGVVLKRNTSNPTPPTNHVHSAIGGGESNTGFVTLEEHNQLKERVAYLENELELIKMQLKASGHRGHIV